MNRSNPVNSAPGSNRGVGLHLSVTDYEIAVLSTLFDKEDEGKVMDLARQWGYEQDFLQSVWNAMHSELGTPAPSNQ